MARNESENDRGRWGPEEDRDAQDERGERRWRDRSRGELWHGRDREQGYSGGMGSWSDEPRQDRWGTRYQHSPEDEGGRRGDQRGSGREDLERGERGWGGNRRDDWRGPERGDEWRQWSRNDDRDDREWSGSQGHRWSRHMANWGEGAGTERYRGQEGGWGGYGSYDRDVSRRGDRYGDRERETRPEWERERRDRQEVGRGWDQAAALEDQRRRGLHAGRGPRNYQRSDERIHEEIIQRLTDHPDIDATDIEVEVKNGEVTLRGTVDERNARYLAEDLADRVWGARDVHNEIRVQRLSTGLSSGAAAFHSGSNSNPALTAPGGRMPETGRHQTQEGSNAGEDQPQSGEHRENVSSGDQGLRSGSLTGSKR